MIFQENSRFNFFVILFYIFHWKEYIKTILRKNELWPKDFWQSHVAFQQQCYFRSIYHKQSCLIKYSNQWEQVRHQGVGIDPLKIECFSFGVSFFSSYDCTTNKTYFFKLVCHWAYLNRLGILTPHTFFRLTKVPCKLSKSLSFPILIP